MKAAHLLFTCGLAAVFFAAFWLASFPHSLVLADGDDYSWYQSLFLMHDAITGAADRRFIVSNTFYGWPFWLVNLAAAFPFFGDGWENDAGILLACRSVTCLFAVAALGTLAVSYGKEAKQRNKSFLLALVPAASLLLMPIWWKMAIRIHPQHMLFFFEMLIVLFLIRDRYRLGHDYWYASLCAGLALAVKLEALMMAPLFLAYLIVSRCVSGDDRKTLKYGAGGLAVSIAIFFLLNPYLLVPDGARNWLSLNLGNLTDLRHGQPLNPVAALSQNYYPFAAACFLLAVIWWDAASHALKRQPAISQWLAPYISVSLIFCLFYVTKNEPYYWLAPMALLSFGFVYLPKNMTAPSIVVTLFSVAASPAAAETRSLFADRANGMVWSPQCGKEVSLTALEARAKSQGREIAHYLVAARRPIISAYSDVDFRSLGVRYVERIYGCLSTDTISKVSGHRMALPAPDLVIIRRDDAILDPQLCPKTAEIVQSWRSGQDAQYVLLEQTDSLMVFGFRNTRLLSGNIWNGLRRL